MTQVKRGEDACFLPVKEDVDLLSAGCADPEDFWLSPDRFNVWFLLCHCRNTAPETPVFPISSLFRAPKDDNTARPTSVILFFFPRLLLDGYTQFIGNNAFTFVDRRESD